MCDYFGIRMIQDTLLLTHTIHKNTDKCQSKRFIFCITLNGRNICHWWESYEVGFPFKCRLTWKNLALFESLQSERRNESPFKLCSIHYLFLLSNLMTMSMKILMTMPIWWCGVLHIVSVSIVRPIFIYITSCLISGFHIG